MILKLSKRIISVFLILLLSVAIILSFSGCSLEKKKDLDLIKSYNIEVEPQKNGTLNITYNIEWEVLDGESEGPLSWVELGIANPNSTVIEYGGAVKSYFIYGSYIKIDFDREYKTGERVNFWIKINQNNILCTYRDDPTEGYYEFTPGWFDEIKVEQYKFSWKYSEGILNNNSDRKENDMLIWSGELEKGEKRTMEVYYKLSSFVSPRPISKNAQNNYESEQDKDSTDSANVILFLILILICTFIRSVCAYDDGRGYGGYHHFHGGFGGGGGGGCACACAGCACACAGGGRAGCSVKDFYSNLNDQKEDEEIQKILSDVIKEETDVLKSV